MTRPYGAGKVVRESSRYRHGCATCRREIQPFTTHWLVGGEYRCDECQDNAERGWR